MLDLIANLAIPLIMLVIVVYGKYKKVDIFESFIAGAIDGLKTALNILPYIIGIFIAIGIFKSGKGIEMLEFILAPIANLFKMYSELAARVSVDSLIEKMGATIVGASETVFYTMAIYYGSQKIKKTGHTLICALLSHFAGVLASVYICYLMFG